jgi:glycosyltransferase involved in cell wall biosynthesis
VSPRRVVFVVRASRGGMSRHVVDLAAHLPGDRYELVGVLAPPDDRLEREFHRVGVPFVPVEMADGIDLLADLGTVRTLRSDLEALSPDLVHFHSNKAAFVGRRAVRRLAARPATAFTAHNYPSFERSGFVRRTLGRRALARVGADVDRTIAVSFALAGDLVENVGFDPAKVAVVHNGIDAAAVAAGSTPEAGRALREATGIPADAVVVGTIGRLVRDKGLDVLFRALGSLVDRHQELHCVVVGDGPDETRLREVAASLRIEDRVVFAGFVDDVGPWLAAMDVFALPTLVEAFGMSALEAMAAGVPIVASSVGGVPEVVADDTTGMLVDPGDANALADTLSWLITDPGLRTRLADQARVSARRFSLEAMADGTARVYDEALGA